MKKILAFLLVFLFMLSSISHASFEVNEIAVEAAKKKLEANKDFKYENIEEILQDKGERDSAFFTSLSDEEIRDFKYALFLSSNILYPLEERELAGLKDYEGNLLYHFLFHIINPVDDLETNFLEGLSLNPDADYEDDVGIIHFNFDQAPVRHNFKKLFALDLKDLKYDYAEDFQVGIDGEKAYISVPYWIYEYPNLGTDMLIRNIEDYGDYALVKFYKVYIGVNDGPEFELMVEDGHALLEKIDGKIYPSLVSKSYFTKDQVVDMGLVPDVELVSEEAEEVPEEEVAEEIVEAEEVEEEEKIPDLSEAVESNEPTLLDKYWPVIYIILIGALILLMVLARKRVRERHLVRSKIKYCPNCGEALDRDAKSCSNCGSKLE